MYGGHTLTLEDLIGFSLVFDMGVRFQGFIMGGPKMSIDVTQLEVPQVPCQIPKIVLVLVSRLGEL